MKSHENRAATVLPVHTSFAQDGLSLSEARNASRWSTAVMVGAIGAPFLLAYNRPPSPSALNELLALAGWGVVVVLVARRSGPAELIKRALGPAVAALALLFMASLAAGLLGSVVKGPAFAFAALTAAAAVVLVAAASSAAGGRTEHVARMRAFHLALLMAGALSAVVAWLQIFAPHWTDGIWISASGGGGRAVGNMRQSNHLSTLLLFAAAALVALTDGHRLGRGMAWCLMFLLMVGAVLSGSRTGSVGVLVMAIWGLLDGKLLRSTRTLLVATPLLYATAWLGVFGWAEYSGTALGAADRLSSAGGETTGNRLVAWRNTLDLIAANPWRGVGFGEFNFALTLTPFDHRSSESPIHAHNLPLHLIVELGLPLGVLIVSLLLASMLMAGRTSWRMRGMGAVETRAAFTMLVLIVIHSQLEYPLWYGYFLLPTAWALGACLGSVDATDAQQTRDGDPGGGVGLLGHRPRRWFMLAGTLMVIASGIAFVDYRQVASAFVADDMPTSPGGRFSAAQGSWLFAHHADYAAAVTAKTYSEAPLAFARAPHYVLDGQLLRAWSHALAQQGDVERARHVAQRLHELGTAEATAFFAPCTDASVEPKPYQCEPPSRAMDWRHFRWLGAGS
jgi:O-antigen ligase